MKKSMKVFMREDAKTEEVVMAPGPSNMLDENGKPIVLEIKVLSATTLANISENYTQRHMATDNKGRPYIQNGEVAYRVTKDNRKATGHILAEALVYPDLKDPELMKFFGAVDISEMAGKVFPRTDELEHVNRVVLSALGLNRAPDAADTTQELNDLKN